MKKLRHIYSIPLLLITIFMMSCNDEDVLITQNKISVQFTTAEKDFEENSGSQTIAITLSQSAQQNGTITILVTGGAPGSYETLPASVNGFISLPIAKGTNAVELKLIPIDNSVVNESTVISFQIKSVSAGVEIGATPVLKATILDDESPEPVQFSVANFISQQATLIETNETGLEIQIHFSEAISSEGHLTIGYESVKAVSGEHFRTEPDMVNGKLMLHPALNTNMISFKVYPINNTIISGDLEILFHIENVGGSITKGTSVTEPFKIQDDELIGKVKGYQIGAGNWGLKETIEYNTVGDIHTVLVEKSTPSYSAHTRTYFYNTQRQLTRINEYENIDIVYTWENNVIVKSEEINHGIVKSYTLYDYDTYGNVAGTANYYRQPDGTFALGMTILYLNFPDGNVYKKLMYVPQDGSDEDVLVQTETFEHYVDGENPFPMVRILPNIKSQKKLPLTYRIEKDGADMNYTFSYEFRTDGLVGKRTATSGAISETVVYFYY